MKNTHGCYHKRIIGKSHILNGYLNKAKSIALTS